jgi:UDP-2-acetamido-2,6-beta-L-arabino-hexul-4-ose reductase
LVDKLINALSATGSKASVIFSSSTQESRNNIYGKSKKEGRLKFIEWGQKNKSGFTGLVIPNVFGPFGRPFYNSVITTFSHQLINGETPVIEIDAELSSDLCNGTLFGDRNNIKPRYKIDYRRIQGATYSHNKSIGNTG